MAVAKDRKVTTHYTMTYNWNLTIGGTKVVFSIWESVWHFARAQMRHSVIISNIHVLLLTLAHSLSRKVITIIDGSLFETINLNLLSFCFGSGGLLEGCF